MKSRADLWQKWLKRYFREPYPPVRFLEFDNTILAIQAAIETLGVALIPSLFLDEILRGGSLIEVPNTESISTGEYHILHHHNVGTPEILAFTAWLKSLNA